MKKFYCILLLITVLSAPFFRPAEAAASQCVTLKNNLEQGYYDDFTGGEVSTLQTWLKSQGYYKSPITGFFGEMTKKAVIDLQNQKLPDIASEWKGMVGPKTRAYIEDSCTQSLGVSDSAEQVAASSVSQNVGGIKLGSLSWSAKKSQTPTFTLKESNPKLITHTITSQHRTDPLRSMSIGLNSQGGGFAWSTKVSGYPGFSNRELGAAGYGRGFAGSIRDRYHSNRYNPEQAGKTDIHGVVVEPLRIDGGFAVPQYQMPLYSDGALSPIHEQFPVSNSASEFDYSTRMTDVSRTYSVPAVAFDEYYVYARKPDAIKQFTGDETIKAGPAKGQPVLNKALQIKDISPRNGVQTPTTTDMSYLVYTHRGLRVPSNLNYAHYRSNGEWVTKTLQANSSLDQQFTCNLSKDRRDMSYIYETTDKKVSDGISTNCVIDEQLIVFSNSPDVTKGFGLGVYLPKNQEMNKNRVHVINTKKNKVEWREDRNIQRIINVEDYTDKSGYSDNGYFFAAVRDFMSGLLSPESATKAYGFDAVEALTGRTVVLTGTPAEVLEGIYKANGQSTLLPDDEPPLSVESDKDKPADIIIVGGQSNAVGRGQGSYTEKKLFIAQAPRVFQFGRFDSDNLVPVAITKEPLQHWGQNPYSTSAEIQNSFSSQLRGFAYPFALRYATRVPAERNVLILPVAKGGTTILQWDNVASGFTHGGSNDSTELYDDMVVRIKKALALNPGNKVTAVLWQHGEADVNALANPHSNLKDYMTSADLYAQKLTWIRDNIRKVAGESCLPFLIGDTAPEWQPVNGTAAGKLAKEQIRMAAQSVAKNDTCGTTVFVPAFRVTSNPGTDTIHMNAQGQYEMARNYWGQYSTLKK
jgi:peptidoglycan hydrolase-like protein with peptidoglycan-binding domain